MEQADPLSSIVILQDFTLEAFSAILKISLPSKSCTREMIFGGGKGLRGTILVFENRKEHLKVTHYQTLKFN